MSGEFEYAIKKDVRNNPIVREVDRERHLEMWRSVAVGVFLVAVLLFSEHPALGASGGLFGLFGAILGWTVRRGGTVGIEMRRQLMRTLIINIVISCLPGISFAAHAGGFAAGFLATWLFRIAHERSGRESDGVRIAALACIGLLAAGAICAAVAALRWPVA